MIHMCSRLQKDNKKKETQCQNKQMWTTKNAIVHSKRSATKKNGTTKHHGLKPQRSSKNIARNAGPSFLCPPPKKTKNKETSWQDEKIPRTTINANVHSNVARLKNKTLNTRAWSPNAAPKTVPETLIHLCFLPQKGNQTRKNPSRTRKCKEKPRMPTWTWPEARTKLQTDPPFLCPRKQQKERRRNNNNKREHNHQPKIYKQKQNTMARNTPETLIHLLLVPT